MRSVEILNGGNYAAMPILIQPCQQSLTQLGTRLPRVDFASRAVHVNELSLKVS